ncbi:MAG: ComEC/Rec2 family competence protein [Puniceicoccales bacterium]|nr:ComEC/Rec2 family competence protein [Puniceicoccales bacterium]
MSREPADTPIPHPPGERNAASDWQDRNGGGLRNGDDASGIPAGSSIGGRGHLPLLWVLLPLLAGLAFCFATDFHSMTAGAVLVLAGGGVAAFLAWHGPALHPSIARCLSYGLAYCIGGVGLAFLSFSARIAPLPDWEGLPAREADLLLQWEQLFASRPGSKSTSGVARVLGAPTLLPELRGTSVYCSLGNPVPGQILEIGAVFRARGVLDDARHQAAETSARLSARREAALARAAARQQSASRVRSESAFAMETGGAGIPAPASRGQRDGFVRYLEGRRATMSFSRGSVLEVVQEPPIVMRWCAAQRKRLMGILACGLEDQPESAALYSAILLRQTAGVDRSVREDFARTGTAHLFSVSGLHVGVISAALFWVGRRFRIPDTAWRMAVIASMFVFVMITGGSPAALRAWLMVSCILAAKIFTRRGGTGSGWAMAATGALLWNPALLLDIGFQLSYGVVAALVFYGIPLAEFLRERWHPWRDLPVRDLGRLRRAVLGFLAWLAGGIGVGAASMLAGAPLILHHFGLFSAGSILANLVVVPLAFPVMVLGFSAVALGVCGLGALAAPLNWLAGQDLALLARIVSWLSRMPGMSWEMEYTLSWVGPATTVVLLFAVLLLPLSARPPIWALLVPPALFAFLLPLFARVL